MTVTDDDGATAQDTVSITVEPPVECEITFDADIEIPFMEPIDPQTVGDQAVEVVDPEGNPVNVEISLTQANTLLRIRPRRNLRLGARYTVSVMAGIQDLDGESFPVKPMTSILIKPLCRHRATGNLKVTVTAIPAFNQKDEWFDEEKPK